MPLNVFSWSLNNFFLQPHTNWEDLNTQKGCFPEICRTFTLSSSHFCPVAVHKLFSMLQSCKANWIRDMWEVIFSYSVPGSYHSCSTEFIYKLNWMGRHKSGKAVNIWLVDHRILPCFPMCQSLLRQDTDTFSAPCGWGWRQCKSTFTPGFWTPCSKPAVIKRILNVKPVELRPVRNLAVTSG